MASYTNQNKATATFANQARGFADVTWDEATFTWDEATFQWDDPRDIWAGTTKNTATMTNQTKN